MPSWVSCPSVFPQPGHNYIVVEGPLAGGHLGFSMDELRARLENDVQNLREEVARLRQRGLLRRS